MRDPGRNETTRARRISLSVLALACLAWLLPSVAAAQSETPAEKAAREIREARDRANAAADAFFQAQSDLELLEDEIERLEREEDGLQETVDTLQREVELVAVSRFVQSGSVGIPLLTEVDEPNDQLQADVLVGVFTNTSGDVIDEFEAAEDDLRDLQDEISRRQDDLRVQQAEFQRLQDEATAEVERLREIEAQRLEDEAVQRALEAQLAEERARLEEAARQEAEAEARARPNPGVEVIPTTLPPETTLPTDGASAEPVGDGAAGAGAAGAGDGAAGADGDGPATTDEPVETAPPATTIPPDSGGSGGTSGGRTGEGGGGNSPGGVDTGGAYIDNIVCPIVGSAYGDTWGAPRSGGRRHTGVDMLAPTGTPIYAVIGGFATFKTNRLGGNAVSLVGDNGNRYYYAHFDRWEGQSRYVQQGEVIGYNGDTGNARGTPHLHFQIHPGNGQPVNPYPTMRAIGC